MVCYLPGENVAAAGGNRTVCYLLGENEQLLEGMERFVICLERM